MPFFIIEHLEEKLWEWCRIEYQHISQIVGKKNCWFTNVSSARLRPSGKVIPKSVTTLRLPLEKVCVLDPDAPQLLTPAEAKTFDYFIFGGILGDHPPQARTSKELSSTFPHPVKKRNIGKEQLSTDNAVAVVKEIIKGKHLAELSFQDGIEIHLRQGESIQFPFRYLMKKGKPLVSPKLIAYLKKRKDI